MLYLFTWNNEYLVKEEIKKWKNHFLEKYWDFNLIHIKNIEDQDKTSLSGNLLASSFMSEKKLVIIENIEKLEKDEQKKEYFMSIFSKIPDDNIVLLSSNSLQERSLLYKKCLEVWEVKRFDIKNIYETKSFIEKKYNWNIEQKAIDKIVSYKSNNLAKIINELDKLFITKKQVKEQDIIDYIIPEFEETIFVLVDKILNEDKKNLFKDLDIILDNIDIYAFYNMLIWNLRNIVYIQFLKQLWNKKESIIKDLALWNRWFLVDKKYKLSNQNLFKLYFDFIDFDQNMKYWKLIWSSKEDLKYELQKILI